MRYLVTGGCGFIGLHLVQALLAGGHEVVVLDDLSSGREAALPEGVRLIEGCVTDAGTVARTMAGVDGIFHLAAIASVARSTEEWLWTHRVNQGGTVTVFEAARARRRPVVYASSAAVYGDQRRLPLDETLMPLPLTAYGADKLGSELHGRVAALIHGVPNVGLRFFNVFGPGQPADSPYSGVISIFAHRLARGVPLTLHGSGEQTRDFIHVGDVVRALRLAMDRCLGGGDATALVCNVCSGVPTSIADLAERLMAVAGRRVPLEHRPPRLGDVPQSLGDPAAAERLLGFRAETPLGDGLRALLAATEPVP